MIEDMAALSIPFFAYYDSSWDSRLSAFGGAKEYSALSSMPLSTIYRRRDRQRAVYGRAAGVVTMSHWLARSLVKESGLPPERVHVVHPGISASSAPARLGADVGRHAPGPTPERSAPRRRLLFVGRQYHIGDFFRKGGDLAVAALAVLRRDYDPRITLTIAGVPKWPLPGPVPDGVRLLGVLPRDDVAALYDNHDLFVMPARLEPFGIVFTEALARGLPCVARYAYAMPEIVTPGISGALVTSDDVQELAATIAAVLADDSLYDVCRDRAPALARYFSWERAASQMMQIVATTLNQQRASKVVSTTTNAGT
jgi:glycosyltransferase involved in cell wall biosynthesis